MKERPEREQEPARTAPAISARRAAGLTEHLLRLQASAGNAAVSRALARTERIALYYTALRPVRARAEPIEEIDDLFEEAEDPLPFPEGVPFDAPATANEVATARSTSAFPARR